MGTVSLAGVSISGVALVLTKKYPKKLVKATKLIDIVISTLAVFETLVPKVLKDGKINELEFNMIQKLYYESLNDPSDVDHKMEAELRTQLQKVYRKKSITYSPLQSHSFVYLLPLLPESLIG